MNPNFDSVDASDVEDSETLRQSEAVKRMCFRAMEDLCITDHQQQMLERSIMGWLLDNNLVIRKDMR